MEFVIPAKAGIQLFRDVLDPGFRRGDAPIEILGDHLSRLGIKEILYRKCEGIDKFFFIPHGITSPPFPWTSNPEGCSTLATVFFSCTGSLPTGTKNFLKIFSRWFKITPVSTSDRTLPGW